MINKATFMIVTPTNPQKSRYVIVINADSTIAPPPYISLTTKSRRGLCIYKMSKVATHSAYSHFINNDITLFFIIQANKTKFHKFL